MRTVLLTWAIFAQLKLVISFTQPILNHPQCEMVRTTQWRRSLVLSTKSLASRQTDQDDIIPLLFAELQMEPQNATLLSKYIEKLEEQGCERRIDDQSPTRFDPLLGLYDVPYVKTSRAGDNPVGGKWTRKNGIAQKLLRTRRSFQHILAANETGLGQLSVATGAAGDVVGEAVNVISLEAFWGLIRTTVILRGDAVAVNATERSWDGFCQPLSAFAVRALFDAPRIVVGKTGRFLNVNVGPKTSVVLDTTFVDDTVRIGLGGRSGSRFVFARCPADDMQTNEFRALLSRKPWSKTKTLTALATVACVGTYGGASARGGVRVLAASLAAFSVMTGALIAFSGGGIEAGDRSVAEAKTIFGKDGAKSNNAIPTS